MLAHLVRTGGAVDADDIDTQRVDGGQRRADLGARQHPARDLDGDLGLDGQVDPGGGHGLAAADHRGLEPEEVELGLDEQHVDAAALEQPGHLHLVGVAQVGEPDLLQRRELRAGADRTGHQAAVPARDLARDAGRCSVDLEGPLRDVVLGEGDREGTEGGGLHHVGPDLEEVVVHLADEVGPGEHEHLVAALEGVTTEVVRGQVELLHVGAEGTVVDHDPLGDQVEELALAHRTRVPAGCSGPRSGYGARRV